MSKNAVLFDNKGQVINSANAEGKIIYFYTGKNIDYTAGDAANAFDQFTGVVKNLRSILFVNKKYFIVFDELENKKAVTNQWLLHSKTEMSFNAINNDVEVTKNNANLLVKFILPEKNDLKFTKTDEFAVPIDKAYTSKYKKDWHFTANAFKASAKREFISFLYPYKKDFKENFSIENLKTFKGFILFCRTGDDNDIIFLSKENERIAENDINFLKGRAAVISKKTAKTNFSMIDGTELRSGDLNILSSGLINIEGQLEESKAELNINSSGKAEIKIKILFEPKDIEGISREKFKYDSKNKTAEIIVDRDSVIKLKK